jgi:hypothetical protein
MVSRNITGKLIELHRQFPVVSVTGPRQSGKTTLIKSAFPEHSYVSLEDPDTRLFATEDPRGFLSNYPKGAILDEVQRVPALFSYLQGVVDAHPSTKFILSGSQNFLLSDNISQSLAGRTAILKLLPFSLMELKNAQILPDTLNDVIFQGFYPRIYDQNIPPLNFYPGYIQTYLERDVPQLTQVGNIQTFTTFLKLCAGRVGQLINMSQLANDAGVAVNTVRNWLNILESSYIIFRLYPHHQNFNKRLTKMPKLYFYDVGLLANLLGIRSSNQIESHFAKGGIFENLIISEIIKRHYHKGHVPSVWFWRDHKGKEIDVLIDLGQQLIPVEIKSGKTMSADYFKSPEYWNKLSGNSADSTYVIYGGDQDMKTKFGQLVSWRSFIDSDFYLYD